ncbi:MAG: phage tail sheath subtilisin-like domain-containing protein [Sphingomonas sp.]
MPEYLAPGVFMEEVSYRAKSIEGVSTTTTGFVGATRYGPIDIEPDIITSLVEFERVYAGRQQLEFEDGGKPTDNYMWNAVRAFFEEGGKRLYVARAFNGDPIASCATIAGKSAPPANVSIRARFPGKAGEARVRLQFWVSQNRLVITASVAQIRASQDRDVVYIGGGAAKTGVFLVNYDAQKDQWTFTPQDGSADVKLQDLAATPTATVRTITATVFVEPGEPGLPFFAATGLAIDRAHKTAGALDSLFDYFSAEPANLSAARSIPIVFTTLTEDEATVERDAAKAHKADAKTADTKAKADLATVTGARDTEKGKLDQANTDLGTAQTNLAGDPANLALIQAVKDAQKAGDDQQKILDAAEKLIPPAQAIADAAAADLAAATDQFTAAEAVLTAAATDDTNPRNGAQLVWDYRAAAATTNRFVTADLSSSTGTAPFFEAVFFLTEGSDGNMPILASFEGSEDATTNRKSGLVAFEDIEDISIVAAPGSTFTATSAQAVANALIGHAERMQYRIAVLDSIKGQSIADVRAYRAKFDSSHAAFYYPWVRIIDPETGQENLYPPCGFVAGIYARNDIERAVFKAPANEIVTLALGFEKLINKAQQEVLNPEGINCFRFFEGRGMRLWGARTASSDPEWKYVNLRRYFAYLERSIDKGTQWAVFEPNGERLWDNVRRTIEDFLLNEWQSGALLGDKPERSYFVKCDRSTMTQNDLDNGRLVCLVGVSPLRPAEFVIFRIGQWTADRKS